MSALASAAHLDARWRDALRRCERVLCHVRVASLYERLDRVVEDARALVDSDEPLDAYGDGVVRRLECQVAGLLGTAEAAFFPSGMMAQQAALRIHAARQGQGVVALHPLSHPQLRESDALTAVAGLSTLPLGDPARCLVADDMRRIRDRVDVLMLELPLRDAGFVLPTWMELVELATEARARGAALHIDGARLWECTPHFGRPLAEIAALADSVYLSFYKSLGGLSGAILTGKADFIEQARLWRHRYGGLQFQQFPAAIAAMAGLAGELPRLPAYVAKAAEVADALHRVLAAEVPGARVHPHPPHTQQFQVWMPFPAQRLAAAGLAQVVKTGVAMFDKWREPGVPGLAMTEMTIGSSALPWSARDVEQGLEAFLSNLRN